MPTISINLKDFERLLNRPATVQALEEWLPLVKGELKDHVTETGEVRIELQDSNRPDLWSCEGIARQIALKLARKLPAYPFFAAAPRRPKRLTVAPGLDHVRPYVAACTAVGYRVTAEGLEQLIQVQEKLADVFGRKRSMVSIGLYRLPAIVFPVTYDLVGLDEARFTPLGFDDKMSLRDILAVHPKGLEYGHLLAGQAKVPLLRDDEGQVLSLPPIINSREIGEVRVGDSDLFVEVTGTNLPMVLLTLNIMAVNLADRGATIEPVQIAYPYKTDRGKTVRTPCAVGTARTITVSAVHAALGQPLKTKDIKDALTSYGYLVSGTRDRLTAKAPPYRNDVMHPVDLVEDVAISRGYESFAPIMPAQFTVGGLSRIERLSDRVRELLIGAGFQEMMSNILTSRQGLIERMRLAGTTWDHIVEVDNPMVQTYACLRQWLTPSLLRMEAASSRAFYPHRLFEVGEVAVPDATEAVGSRTRVVAGALLAHADANFSEAHSCLDLLLFYLNRPYRVEPVAHPSFIEGRAGQICFDGTPVGLIGEIHPQVLEHWQVTMPVAAFEFDVDALVEGVAAKP